MFFFCFCFCFLFFCRKKSTLTYGDAGKRCLSRFPRFSAIWKWVKIYKKCKIAAKIWNLTKSEYYPPWHHWAMPWHFSWTARHSISNISTTTSTSPTKPWNVKTCHYHTSYYTDHRFPIININRFVIHCCEFYFCLNWTVLFICFMTEHETAPCLLVIINW